MLELILPLSFVILFLLFWLIKDGFKHGQSPGKSLCGLMVVNLVENRPCSIGKSIIRNIFGLTSIMLYICFLSVRDYISLYGFRIGIVALLLAILSVSLILIVPLFNNRGQHPGDRIAKTQVIETKDYKPERYY